MPYRNNEIKSGMIVMWSGLVADVPNGWSICDGTNGTPDLQDKFVRGTAGEVGGQGGCANHCHTVSYYMSGTMGSPVSVVTGSGCQVAAAYHSHSLYLASSTASNLPPYYELIFIRKD